MPPSPPDPTPSAFERRAARGVALASRKGRPLITGRAIAYNALSGALSYIDERGARRTFRERIMPGALAACLAKNPDVRALVDHDAQRIVGRTKAGTLRLRPDAAGLVVEIDPPDSNVGRDLVESIRRGDLDGMSFGFTCDADRWTVGADGVELREITALTLHEVSAVVWPAYAATTLSVRALKRHAAPPPPPPARSDRTLLALARARLALLDPD